MSKSAAIGEEITLTPEQRAEQYKALRRRLDMKASVTDERWKAKAAILASVKETGPLRHLYQIVALDDAGLYLCPDIAKDARKRIAERGAL